MRLNEVGSCYNLSLVSICRYSSLIVMWCDLTKKSLFHIILSSKIYM